MDQNENKIDLSKYYEHTLREKDSICPLKGTTCPEDPKICGRYQPFRVIEMVLNVPKTKTVYMCIDDSMRMTLETILQHVQQIAVTNVNQFKLH